MHIFHHYHWAAVVSRGWAKASACHLQYKLACLAYCMSITMSSLSEQHVVNPLDPLSFWFVTLANRVMSAVGFWMAYHANENSEA